MKYLRVLIQAFPLLLAACASSPPPSLDKQVSAAGFTPVIFPSTQYKPGQLESQSSHPDNLYSSTVICSPAEFAGAPKVETYDAANSSEIQKLNGTFDISAKYKNNADAQVDLKYVKNITVTLSNVQIESVSRAAIADGVKNQSAACRGLISNSKANGAQLVVIEQALKANAEFKVELDTGAVVSASAAQDALKNVAGSLKIGPEYIHNNTISGNGLYIGVKASTGAVMTASTERKGTIYSEWVTTADRNNMPCGGRAPCSSTGKWWAVDTPLSITVTKPDRTMTNPTIECYDNGTGACVFHNPWNVTPGATTSTAIGTTFSIPVKLRMKADEWGAVDH